MTPKSKSAREILETFRQGVREVIDDKNREAFAMITDMCLLQLRKMIEELKLSDIVKGIQTPDYENGYKFVLKRVLELFR